MDYSGMLSPLWEGFFVERGKGFVQLQLKNLKVKDHRITAVTLEGQVLTGETT